VKKGTAGGLSPCFRVDWNARLRSHVHYMHVSPEARVIGEVIALVVGILVEDDVVAIPPPAVTISKFCWGDTEGEATEPESTRTTPFDTPYVVGTEATLKATMLPGVIDVEAVVVATGVVTHPLATVDVRSIGVTFLITEVPLRLNRLRIAMKLFWPAGGRSLMPLAALGVVVLLLRPIVATLCERGQRDYKEGKQD